MTHAHATCSSRCEFGVGHVGCRGKHFVVYEKRDTCAVVAMYLCECFIHWVACMLCTVRVKEVSLPKLRPSHTSSNRLMDKPRANVTAVHSAKLIRASVLR